MVVVTSLALPLSMPLMLEVLAGARIQVPFRHMFVLLAQVIFIPLISATAVRKLWPALSSALSQRAYPISLLLMCAINIGTFGLCSGYFKAQTELLGFSLGLAFASAFFGQVFGAGMALCGRGWLNPYTSMINLHFGNNLIAIIFAAQFFGPKAPLVSGMYMLPLFIGLLSLRPLAWMQRLGAPASKDGTPA